MVNLGPKRDMKFYISDATYYILNILLLFYDTIKMYT